MDRLYQRFFGGYLDNLSINQQEVFQTYPYLFENTDNKFITFCFEYNILYYMTKDYREKCLDETHTSIEYNHHIWLKDNRYHRENNLPAIIYEDGTLGWRTTGNKSQDFIIKDLVINNGNIKNITFNIEEESVTVYSNGLYDYGYITKEIDDCLYNLIPKFYEEVHEIIKLPMVII